ncbi:hypothetical protein HID58_069528 [Brassica napus]|uniref:Signal recognition particle 19 kDa protein n=1 Tax=Brassica napus TaxID=3708 RepID=A0ABQ7YWA7_BRANA|nr:hypothetical protein HID58_069528 [Brassica napus]
MDSGTLNIKKWVVMYPVYINSKKTVAEGRMISLSKACENPNCIEISDCCKHLKLPSAVEIDKAYPRDFMQVGRVRVQLKREDGSCFLSFFNLICYIFLHCLISSPISKFDLLVL